MKFSSKHTLATLEILSIWRPSIWKNSWRHCICCCSFLFKERNHWLTITW